MRTRASLLLAIALLLSSCRPDTIELQYRYSPGTTLRYRMDAVADARWDIGVAGKGSYRASFEVSETVESSDSQGAVVSVQMHPLSSEQHGLPPPSLEDRSFKLQVGRNGEVRQVLEVDGVPASALDPDELVFIGTYRPPLPLQRVGLTDQWKSEQQVQIGAVFQQIATVGRLDGLNEDADGAYAELSYRGDGPLVWNTKLPEGRAELKGSAASASTATVDLGGGFLRSASSETTGTFDVTVSPVEGSPGTGTMRLRLELRLNRIS